MAHIKIKGFYIGNRFKFDRLRGNKFECMEGQIGRLCWFVCPYFITVSWVSKCGGWRNKEWHVDFLHQKPIWRLDWRFKYRNYEKMRKQQNG